MGDSIDSRHFLLPSIIHYEFPEFARICHIVIALLAIQTHVIARHKIIPPLGCHHPDMSTCTALITQDTIARFSSFERRVSAFECIQCPICMIDEIEGIGRDILPAYIILLHVLQVVEIGNTE